MNIFTMKLFLHLTGKLLNSRVSLQAEEITIAYTIYSTSMQETQAVSVEFNGTVSLLETDSLSKVQSSGFDLEITRKKSISFKFSCIY